MCWPLSQALGHVVLPSPFLNKDLEQGAPGGGRGLRPALRDQSGHRGHLDLAPGGCFRNSSREARPDVDAGLVCRRPRCPRPGAQGRLPGLGPSQRPGRLRAASCGPRGLASSDGCRLPGLGAPALPGQRRKPEGAPPAGDPQPRAPSPEDGAGLGPRDAQELPHLDTDSVHSGPEDTRDCARQARDPSPQGWHAGSLPSGSLAPPGGQDAGGWPGATRPGPGGPVPSACTAAPATSLQAWGGGPGAAWRPPRPVPAARPAR